MQEVVKIPIPEDAVKYHKYTDEWLDTCKKIRSAWYAKGYSGDPIVILLMCIIRAYQYGADAKI